MAASMSVPGPAAPPGVDASQLAKLAHVADITRLLHELVVKERSIDADLDWQMAQRGELERDLLQLNSATSEALELARADSEALLSGVSATAMLATRISAKVRRLDAASWRITVALELIQLILERTRCVSGAQEALARQDYEAAAECVATFLQLESRLSPLTRSMDGAQVEEQRQLLLGVKGQLEVLVAQKLSEAAAARNHLDVLRYVQLHKPLGKSAAGLARYIEYSRSIIATHARERYSMLSAALERPANNSAGASKAGVLAEDDAAFAGAMTALFKELALSVEADEEAICTTFGPSAVLDVVLGLQQECDAAGSRLLARFSEHRRLGRLVTEVRSRKRAGEEAPIAEGGPDPRKVEAMIQELVLLVQRAEEYNSFMLGRMRAAAASATAAAQAQLEAVEEEEEEEQTHVDNGRVHGPAYVRRKVNSAGERIAAAIQSATSSSNAAGTGGDDGGSTVHSASAVAAAAAVASSIAARLAASESAFRSGAFNVAVRELLGHYVGLEEFYMEETVRIAIRIDVANVGSLTSSLVDDAFFILKKCGTRALSTGSVQCAAALIGEVNDLLANQLRGALVSRLAGGPGRLLASITSGNREDDSRGVEHAVAINNVDVAAEYSSKLRTELEAYADAVFVGISGERERLRSVLVDLGKTGSDFRGLATKALEGLADALLSRLRPVLDEAGTASYALTEADYGTGDLDGTWIVRLIATLQGQLHPLQPLLTTGAWEGLFHALLDKVLARLEVLLSRKSFTQLGGLQLDRDVRALVGALGEMTSRTVRDKFARLTQMASLLSLESPLELMDYWGETSWRLTPAEVRTVLAQRQDFSKEAISSLPL